MGRLSDDAPPWVYVGEEGVCCATGFIPEAETMILNEMQVSETFVSVGSTAKYQQKMYDALDDGTIDVMFQGPIYEPWKGYKLSMPFYDAVNGVVVRKTQKARGPWGVLQPFEAELWFALILAVVAGGLVVAGLEPPNALRDQSRGGCADTLLQGQCGARSRLLGRRRF